ncbi:MAG: putative RNA methyltransferase [Solirubrobacteraceae bacterium]
MLDDVIGYLCCPYCGGELEPSGASVRCPAGHCFDVARQGYVSLLAGDARGDLGDSAAMVAAREEFLGGGHFAPIVDAAATACAAAAGRVEGCIVDLGAGIGHYLAAALEALPDRVGLALDASKWAARRAARAHQRIGAVVCDAWRPLPVRDGAAAVVLSVFAPRDGAEIARVLAPGGALVLVTPTGRHLAELVGALDLLTVDARKDERLEQKLGPFLEPADAERVEFVMRLEQDAAAALAAMGPSARHTNPAGLRERVAAMPDPLAVTASVAVAAWRAR